jgi:hypothetical protein
MRYIHQVVRGAAVVNASVWATPCRAVCTPDILGRVSVPVDYNTIGARLVFSGVV